MKSEKSQCVPPIPEKGQKIDNSRSEDSPSHYDILPHRKSLPMHRHNSNQGIAIFNRKQPKVQNMMFYHVSYYTLFGS